MNNKELLSIVANFKDKKIGVIGDLILDQFVWGDSRRISPEAPVPVVLVKKETALPGGAGNVASNIAALGGKVFIMGRVGRDQAGKQLVRALRTRGVDVRGIISNASGPTTQKTRVIARTQQVVRVDKEVDGYIDAEVEKRMLGNISKNLNKWDGIVISDYAKGCITRKLVQRIIRIAKKLKKPVVADIKPKHATYFKNVTLLTPNQEEAGQIAGTDNVRKAGKAIQEKLKCHVLITQGPQGMTLFVDDKAKYFSTKAKEVFDVTGAGDTVVAVAALSLAVGATMEEATVIANHAAGIVVGKIGTATISTKELRDDLKYNG